MQCAEIACCTIYIGANSSLLSCGIHHFILLLDIWRIRDPQSASCRAERTSARRLLALPVAVRRQILAQIAHETGWHLRDRPCQPFVSVSGAAVVREVPLNDDLSYQARTHITFHIRQLYDILFCLYLLLFTLNTRVLFVCMLHSCVRACVRACVSHCCAKQNKCCHWRRVSTAVG